MRDGNGGRAGRIEPNHILDALVRAVLDSQTCTQNRYKTKPAVRLAITGEGGVSNNERLPAEVSGRTSDTFAKMLRADCSDSSARIRIDFARQRCCRQTERKQCKCGFSNERPSQGVIRMRIQLPIQRHPGSTTSSNSLLRKAHIE